MWFTDSLTCPIPLSCYSEASKMLSLIPTDRTPNVAHGASRPLRDAAHLPGNDGKPAAALARRHARLDGSIQREDIGLKRDPFDQRGDVHNLLRAGRNHPHRATHLLDRRHARIHLERRRVGKLGSLANVIRIALDQQDRLPHARGGFFQRPPIRVNASGFPTIGIAPALARDLLATEHRARRERVARLALIERAIAADPSSGVLRVLRLVDLGRVDPVAECLGRGVTVGYLRGIGECETRKYQTRSDTGGRDHKSAARFLHANSHRLEKLIVDKPRNFRVSVVKMKALRNLRHLILDKTLP